MITERMAGILLHITSLPGRFGIGDLGPEAYKFVDFLAETGQKVWQILPIGPTGYNNSPYSALSALGGNTDLISFEGLRDIGLLNDEELDKIPVYNQDYVDYGAIFMDRKNVLNIAFERFKTFENEELKNNFHRFCDFNNWWLNDYALFMAISEDKSRKGESTDWTQWELPIICHTPEILAELDKQLGELVLYSKFLQFVFYTQWYELRIYANEHGVSIIGDIPINIAHDGEEVWAHPELFLLDENRQPLVVAGLPGENGGEGQRWGNPLFNWDKLRETGYSWLVKRLAKNMELYDMVRFDHFNAYIHFWAIPAHSENPNEGQWLQAYGDELMNAFTEALGHNLPIIVEDFGINTTQEIHDLRDKYGFTGMKILQFAFGGDENNSFLPQNFDKENYLCYTTNHDNNTIRGWFESCSEHERNFTLSLTQTDGSNINWDLIKMALMSKANLAVYQMQDILDLGEEARMNAPGTDHGNWAWRFKWEQVTDNIKVALRALTVESGRI